MKLAAGADETQPVDIIDVPIFGAASPVPHAEAPSSEPPAKLDEVAGGDTTTKPADADFTESDTEAVLGFASGVGFLVVGKYKPSFLSGLLEKAKPAAITRRDQLALKTQKKVSPEEAAAETGCKGRKRRVKRKGKRAGGKRAGGKRVKGKRKGRVSRKRMVMKEWSAEEEAEWWARDGDEDLEEAAPTKKPGAKAKAKAKAAAKGRAKAKASPKTRAKAKASPKTRAKAKASPEAKEPTVKPKAKAKRGCQDEGAPAHTSKERRPDARGSDVCLEQVLAKYLGLGLSTPDSVKSEMIDFAKKFPNAECEQKSKLQLKASLCIPEYSGLTFYWTRPAVGVLRKVDKREMIYVSSAGCPKACTWAMKMMVTAKAAEIFALYMDGLIKDEVLPQDYDDACDEFTGISDFVKAMAFQAWNELADK